MDQLLGVALRVTVTYLYALAALRLAGKRTFGQLSPADAIAAFLLGDMFDNLFWGQVSVAKGVTAFGTVVVLHLVVDYLAFRSEWMSRFVDGTRTLLVRDGRWLDDGLAREHLRADDVVWQLRLKGIETPAELREAALEPEAALSALRQTACKEAQKQDTARLEALLA